MNELRELKLQDIEIIEGLANGCSSKEIADKMHYTLSSVETRRASLCVKFGARNSCHLVAMAVKQNIVKID